jgi:hypothetical protein
MNSFSILRTNVGLTTNVKIVVDGKYNLFLESIDSASELSNTKYKKLNFNKTNYYDDLVPFFFRDLPSDIAFKIKYDSDNDNMFNDFAHQYDDLYQSGCRNIVNNKGYSEEFECFAPLYIMKNIPKNFIVFRVDGPGLGILNKDNFISDHINNLKCVKVFDLTKNTALGEWIETNFTKNPSFPSTPFEIDFRRLEFSTWNGIDYEDGGYAQRAFLLDSSLEYENTYLDMEKMVFDGYKNNKIIFPNILNFSFLFDDLPATPNSLRKWSINRYMGFYIDSMDLVKTVSPYIPPKVKSDVTIVNNILISSSSKSPFDDSVKLSSVIYVEIGGNFYKVEKFEEAQIPSLNKIEITPNSFDEKFSTNFITRYKIISDIKLDGITSSGINQNIIRITSDNNITLSNGGSFTIPNFDSADVWIIDIGGKFHCLNKNKDGLIHIETDYAFNASLDNFEYWINNPDPAFRTDISLIVDNHNAPKTFNIYKLKFSDVKDFDTTILDTEFSKFEYIIKDNLTHTDETKMYSINYDTNRFPRSYEDFSINGVVVNIPVASEYTSNGETFRIVDNDLSTLWRKNSERVKWGFQDSLSSNDYPYLLNNSFSAEDFNRCVNTYDSKPYRHERNLDYFYTVGLSSQIYTHHTLHIDEFDINKYTGTASDYFSYIFGKKSYFDSSNIIKNTKKWSCFNSGDGTIPNTSLFRGIKFKIYDVDSVRITNGSIDSVNIKSSNTYDDYKLSIVVSKNNDSSLRWTIIDNFKHDKSYDTGSVVIHDNILYTNLSTSLVTDPNINPKDLGGVWSVFNNSIFWSPDKTYGESEQVYYNGEYYISNIANNKNSIPSIGDQWDLVILWGNSKVNDNVLVIDHSEPFRVYNDVLYRFKTQSSSSLAPSVISPDLDPTVWTRFYSFVPDTKFAYSKFVSVDELKNSNNIIFDNNRYYLCTSPKGDTLDNGINIYINKKFKNILINIYINDNTLDKLSGYNRDYLYTDIYSKLTASNFMSCINDLSDKFGFSDFVKYIVISEDGSSKTYDFGDITSLTGLPCLLKCESPDELFSRVSSFDRSILSLDVSQFKPKRKLLAGNISTLDMLDFYNNMSLSTTIDRKRSDDVLVPNFHGLKNNIFNKLYRHSGYYMPIFTEIELFKSPGITSSVVGNYKFDTTLTNFGMIKERVISKVNRDNNILKLKNNSNLKSIYPMIDEFGYTTTDFFIFKSSWDFEYFIECVDVKQEEITKSNVSLKIDLTTNNISEI